MSENWFDKYMVHSDNYVGTIKSAADKAMYVGPTGRILTNHADAVTLANVGDYLDAFVTAIEPVKLYTDPVDGSVKASYNAGAMLGKIAYFVVKNGAIWFYIESYTGAGLGWLRYVAGTIKFEGGWGAEDNAHEQRMEDNKWWGEKVLEGTGDVLSGVGDSLSTLGGNLDKMLIVALVAIMVYAFFFARKTLA